MTWKWRHPHSLCRPKTSSWLPYARFHDRLQSNVSLALLLDASPLISTYHIARHALFEPMHTMGTHTPNHGASSAEGAELELMERLKNVELAGGLAVTAVIPPSRHPYQRKTGGFYVTQGDVDQGGLLPKRLSLSEYDPGLLWHTWALMELKKDPQLMQRAIERACLIRLMVPGATSVREMSGAPLMTLNTLREL